MKVCLVCLIGLPASGKTTLAKNLCSCLCDKFTVKHIEYDNVIEWKESEATWREKRQKVLEEVSLIIESSLDQKGNGLVIILDDNMYYRSMRYELYKLARRYRVSYGQIYLKVELEKAIYIDSLRKDSQVGKEVIERMAHTLEEPSENWEKNTLVFDAHVPFDDSLALEFISKTFESPVEVVEPTVWEKEEPTMLHLADLALRSIVGYLIKDFKSTSNKANNIKTFSAALGNRRREIFSGIKSGQILIPTHVREEKDYFKLLLPLFEINEYQ